MRGRGGDLTVNAAESVELTGESADGQFVSGLATQTDRTGTVGDLTITTKRLTVGDGAVVSSSTLGEGQGGNLTVNASDSVEVIGTTADGQSISSLSSRTEGTGAAGDLTITTKRLTVQDGAGVLAGTTPGSEGQGGTLTVNAAESVELIGTTADGQFVSGLGTQTAGGGAAGDLTIATKQLIVRDGAEVNVSSEGTRNAGNLEIVARDLLLDKRGVLRATTDSGEGGNIDLRVQDLLLMRRGSEISTTAGLAGAGGNGGNIDIDTNFLIALPSENSDITANAYEGNGGNINITTQGIFGLEFQEQRTPQSDITASSEFGVDGVVELNTPDVDPSRGLVSLPAVPIDTEVAQAFTPGGSQATSEFVVTGRGGLPPNPNEALSSDAIQVDWFTLNPEVEDRSSQTVSTNPTALEPATIVEAQGWVMDKNGEVLLTASAPTATPHSSWQTPVDCHGS